MVSKRKEIKEYADVLYSKVDKVLYHCDKYFSIYKNLSSVNASKGREILSEVETLSYLGGELNLYSKLDELSEINELVNNAGEDLIEASNKHDDAISPTGSDADLKEGYELILESTNKLDSAMKKLKKILIKYGIK